MTPAMLAQLKLALGIDPADTSKDAFIGARGDGLLAQMRTITQNVLYPPRRFKDTFHGTRYTRNCNEGLTPMHHPVLAVEEITVNGALVDDLDQFPITTDGRISFHAMPAALYSETDITYQAGFDELPADLLEVLTQLLNELIAAIGQAGISALQQPTKITLVDVGSVEFKHATSFADLFGPFGAILDRYSTAGIIGAPLVVESVDLGEITPTP